MLFRQSKKEITMKKKVFSIVLTLAMLVSMFSFFTVPAGATPILFPIEGFIIVPNNEFYHEIILSDLTVGESYNFLLDILLILAQ